MPGPAGPCPVRTCAQRGEWGESAKTIAQGARSLEWDLQGDHYESRFSRAPSVTEAP